MGLTRPRAYQIFDIDYKQSVRVVSVSDVTLSGGAPAQVDGVSLSQNDRVLVTAQNTGSQNGLYYVTTVGTGSNGTWARSVDGNETGEIDAGMIVMVTEGTTYADTQWKLTTNDPIVIGTTALTFVQNYSANSISSGTSNVVVNSNANVTVSAAGTANVLTVTSTGANVAGYLTATGNVTGNYILGNGALLTGVITSVANINSGTSNVTVVSPNGDITVGVGGTSNVGVFSTTGLAITGDLSVTGNATLSGNILGDRIQNGNTQIDIQTQNGNANITVGGVANVAVFSSGGQNVTGYLTASGNITGGNISATNITGTLTTAAQPNITSVGTLSSLGVTGNITGGNLTTTGALSVGSVITNLNPTANATYNLGNSTNQWNDLYLAGNTIYLGAVQLQSATANTLNVRATDGTSNASLVVGSVDSSGNITTSGYLFGNGSQLTGIESDTIGGNITILTRATGNVNFAVVAGYVTILTRSGNVSFALTA